MFKRLFEIDPWKIKTSKFDPQNKRLQESITSLGNGYMGMRGNFEETYSGDTHQGTYFAGVWYPDKTRVGWWKNGYPDYFGKVINGINFIGVILKVDGVVIDLAKVPYEDFYLELDMRNGLLKREYRAILNDKEVLVSFQRFISLDQAELAMIKVGLTMVKGSADVELIPYLDGNVKNEDSNYEEVFWLKDEQEASENSCVMMTTKPNDFGIEQFTVTAMMANHFSKETESTFSSTEKYVAETFQCGLAEEESVFLEKAVVVVTSRDVSKEHQVLQAKELLAKALANSFEELLAKQTSAWAARWQQADIEIVGDDEAQQGIRFNLFQLFSTYYGEDERLNVGPKGFTGEKYGGATYWDTEAYIIPMYLSVAGKDITKQLLKYRHQQLPGAFHNAKQQGLKGALYPMVTFNGIECHNEWEITFEEIHRNAAVAHGIYNYTTYTGDDTYLLTEGIDVLVAISRFWADRVHFSKRENKYMLHGVTGPNEYENNVNNNWYTNTMAAWVLRYTLSQLDKVTVEKSEELAVSHTEKALWQDIVDKMYYPEDSDLGIFVQHDTYLDKDLRPVSELSPDELPLNQHWSWDRVLRSPFIKQADVLQGLYFLNHEFTEEEKRRNFEFYEPMTVHESSLSPCIHSILAAELGMEEKAVEMYQRTARLDLDNYNNDTEDGLHITSMSGSWLSIVHGFAGMRTLTGELSFSPFLPKNWETYQFKLTYRDRLISVKVTSDSVDFTLISGEALDLVVYGESYTLKEALHVPIK